MVLEFRSYIIADFEYISKSVFVASAEIAIESTSSIISSAYTLKKERTKEK